MDFIVCYNDKVENYIDCSQHRLCVGFCFEGELCQIKKTILQARK